MAKQRNSLGVLVLPVPQDTKTFGEYRELYGIDLFKVFPYEIKNSDVYFDPLNESKLIYISENGGQQFALHLVPLLTISGSTIVDDGNIIGRTLVLPVTGYDIDSHVFVSIGELIISVYKDPDTPSTIHYEEI